MPKLPEDINQTGPGDWITIHPASQLTLDAAVAAAIVGRKQEYLDFHPDGSISV